MSFFPEPIPIESLKKQRIWGLDWIDQNQVEGPFEYHILLKQEDGTYLDYGAFRSSGEAFTARRELVEEVGTRSFFLRAARIKQLEHDSEGENNYQLFKDCLRDGNEPPEHLTHEFNAFLSRRRKPLRY
jgi:hypothetical protein